MARDRVRYRVDDETLIWRSWNDDEFVVYHRPSGETHLLNPIAAATLRRLEQVPSSLDELCERIASEFETAEPAEYRSSLADLLDHFDGLGLIRPVRPQ